MTRIIQLSDTHITTAPHIIGGEVDARLNLKQALTRIRDILPLIGGVDLVLISGDLVDHGQPEEYEALTGILEPLEVPIAVIPGNHDLREPLRAAFADLPFMPKEGLINWLDDLPDFRLIGLDSLVEGQSKGMLAPETLDFLREALAGADDRPALVALHHPPFSTGMSFMDRIGLSNAAEFISLINEREAETRVICGHVHRHITGMAGRWPALIAPSTAFALPVNYRDDAPVAIMAETGGFLMHEWGGSFRSVFISSDPGKGPLPL